MVKDQLLRIFPVEGVGSGVIIDKKGYILTNNHVGSVKLSYNFVIMMICERLDPLFDMF
ncbi:hypothetical protein BH23THE1_BH23THE1_22170 [soil metagenome]